MGFLITLLDTKPTVDVFKALQNIGYQVLGIITIYILIVIGAKGSNLINKMAFPAIITLVVGGVFLVLFTNGAASKQLIEQLAQSLLKYAQGG